MSKIKKVGWFAQNLREKSIVKLKKTFDKKHLEHLDNNDLEYIFSKFLLKVYSETLSSAEYHDAIEILRVFYKLGLQDDDRKVWREFINSSIKSRNKRSETTISYIEWSKIPPSLSHSYKFLKNIN